MVITKYAKDLNAGDRINGHEKGWLVVAGRERINLSYFTKVTFGNGETITFDSYTLFDVIEKNK